MARPEAEPQTAPLPRAPQSARRWLLFVHQLPSTPSNLRVRTWRRMQQLGAIPVKQAVYVLPDTPNAREDFEWLKTEVKDAGGDASVFAADNVDAWADDALIEEFRQFAQDAYGALAGDIEKVLKRASSGRRASDTRAPAVRRLVDVFRKRLTAIEAVDFFGSAGRDRVTTLLKQLGERAPGQGSGRTPAASRSSGPGDPPTYRGRLWVTRPRPGVDRMSSAWLIRRFVDPEARFGFAADRDAVPAAGVPFDMFGVELTHRGEGCTFETLCEVFGIREPAVLRIAAIVHDLDLKDGRFGAPEAATVGAVIAGLQLAHADDESLLAQGMSLFEALFASFERSERSAGPRPLARRRKPSTDRDGPDTRRRRPRKNA